MSYNIIIYCVAGIAVAALRTKRVMGPVSAVDGVKNVPATQFTFKLDRGFNVIV